MWRPHMCKGDACVAHTTNTLVLTLCQVRGRVSRATVPFMSGATLEMRTSGPRMENAPAGFVYAQMKTWNQLRGQTTPYERVIRLMMGL